MGKNDDLVNRLSQEQISEIDKASSETRELIQAEVSKVQEEKSFEAQTQEIGNTMEGSGVSGGEHATVGEIGNMGSQATPGTDAKTLIHDYGQQDGYEEVEKSKNLEPEQE